MTDRELTKLVERYCTCEKFKPRFVAKIDAFRNLRSFNAAVGIAAKGEEVDGTKNRHLWQLWFPKNQKYLDDAVKILVGNLDQLKRCKNFDELYQILTGLIVGIPYTRKVYCYDVALRIGAANEFLPEKIYLPSTPVRNAADKLEMVRNADETIDVGALRFPLRKLEPYEVEDFLCIFTKYLKINHSNK
jgi:hypothetical protein